MQDAWRAYLELALGLTEASRRKAQQAVKKLVGQSGTTAAQLQALAEDLMSTSAANRESLTNLVRFEVDRALGLVGLATAEEVAELNARVGELESELRQLRSAVGPAGIGAVPDAGGSVGDAALATALEEAAPSGSGPAQPATATGRAGAGEAMAKKAVAKRAGAKKAVVKQSPAGKTVATRSAAKKTVAKKSPGRKADG